MKDFIEKKINQYSNSIIEANNKIDEFAFGELKFYMSLRRMYEGTATIEDKGFMDAINDTLQELEIVDHKETFLNKIY